MDDDELRRLLRARGHRVTPSRLLVHAALRTGGRHHTAEEVAARVASSGDGEVTLSSVYRALAVLEEVGAARAARLGGDDAMRWELAHPDEHFHVVCTGCGDVRHHRGSLVALLTDHLADDHGFVADDVRLTVNGRCATCRDDVAPVPLR